MSWLGALIVAAAEPGAPEGLTAVPGVLVGHHTLDERATGCTVILAPEGTIGGVDVRGGAPATRETDVLRSDNLVSEVHAVVLSGGSAYGLDSASGVMRFLEERGRGFRVRDAVVPIVVGASLFDLSVGADATVHPGPDCGLRAAKAASSSAVPEGSVGAGAGATVGKLLGLERAMKGGVGSAALRFEDGLLVAGLAAVNAVGDVIDPATGEVVAGARDGKGGLADARRLLLEGLRVAPAETARTNTTLGVVATNARLTKAQANRVAAMAHDGFARALHPAHTLADGDTIFVLATGELEGEPDVSRLGALAAETMARSVVRGARAATGLPGLPAARDLAARPAGSD